MHHPTDRIAHTTAFVTPVVEHWLEREIAQWVNIIGYFNILKYCQLAKIFFEMLDMTQRANLFLSLIFPVVCSRMDNV